MSMLDAIPPAAAPITAGVASFATTLSLAAGAVPVPAELPSWLPYATTIIGPILVLVAQRVLAAFAAARRSLAASQDARAKALLTDKNPANDAEGHKLQDEAAKNRAIADAVEALKSRKSE